MKYVGYTSDPLNKRFSHHRNHITAGTVGHLITHHFTKHHRISNMKVKPIEIYKDRSTIRDRERHWMRELNTLYPCGLTDRYDKDELHDAYIHVTSESRRSNRTSGAQTVESPPEQ